MQQRPIEINERDNIFVKALQQLGVWVWVFVEFLTFNMVGAFFYIGSAFVLMYLDLTLPNTTQFGVRLIANQLNISVVWLITIYVFCGVLMMRSNLHPLTYLVLMIPAIIYTLSLAGLSIRGLSLAWSPAIYTISFVGGIVVAVKYKWQIGVSNQGRIEQSVKIVTIEEKHRQLEQELQKIRESQQSISNLIEALQTPEMTLSSDSVKAIKTVLGTVDATTATE